MRYGVDVMGRWVPGVVMTMASPREPLTLKQSFAPKGSSVD